MKPQRYPEYKDISVEWLGEVPSHWKIVPLWTLYRREKRLGFPEEELLSVYRDYGVIPKASRDDNFNNASEDLTAYQLVEPGCLVINKMKSWQGSVAISQYRGIVSPAYFVYAPLHSHSSKYLHYLLRTKEYTNAYMTISKGIRVNQWDLDPQYHSRLPVLIPPLSEQSAIAAFLDRETGKIDALIAEQEKLIELLREERQAAISHAVTKGLDPTVPMKDSGVEWLGQVPTHWEVTRLGRCLDVLSGFAFPSSGFSDDVSFLRLLRGINIGIESIRWDDVVYWERKEDDGLDNYVLESGQVVMGMDRPWIAEGARVAILANEDTPCLLLQRVAALSPRENLLRDFVFPILVSKDFEAYFSPEMTGVSVPHISPDQIRSFPIALPPLDEQRDIADYIIEYSNSLSALTSEAQHAIDLLKERRSALISAAVTGKIDARSPSAEIIPFAPRQRRNILAAEVISVCHLDHTFGRTKAQKAFYLLEKHLGIAEMDGRYQRYVYGPYDGNQLDSIASDLESAEWFREVTLDGRSIYRPLSKAGEVGGVFEGAWGGRRAEIGKLIGLLRPLDTQEAEVIATLFAAWNDFLLEGRTVDDETLIIDVRTNWHPSKLSIPVEKWHWGLRWMRENNVIPRGVGRPTIYQTSLL
jgi:type I restriction enzyme S subunit